MLRNMGAWVYLKQAHRKSKVVLKLSDCLSNEYWVKHSRNL